MSLKKKQRKNTNQDMESTEKTKPNYFIYFLMIAVVIQLCVLIYRLVIVV